MAVGLTTSAQQAQTPNTAQQARESAAPTGAESTTQLEQSEAQQETASPEYASKRMSEQMAELRALAKVPFQRRKAEAAMRQLEESSKPQDQEAVKDTGEGMTKAEMDTMAAEVQKKREGISYM